MDNCTWSSFPYPSHCRWALPTQAKPLIRCFLCNNSSNCSSSCLAPPVSVSGPLITTRCFCLGQHFPDPVKNLERWLDSEVPVLARREVDGYYYPGKIIKEIQDERRTFLVQFAKPLAGDEGATTCVQKTASSDILEYENGMRHSILPGDKVLAPWEREQKRFGPGTVIRGIETRDPLRGKNPIALPLPEIRESYTPEVKEEEEITVSFWNGKKAKIPLGVALWIPPLRWQSIVGMIRMPLTTRKKFEGQLHRASYHICPCGLLAAPIYTCILSGLHRPHCSFVCTAPRVLPHMCSLHAHPHFSSCCCLKPIDWMQQPSLLELLQGRSNDEEVGSKVNTEFLALEGPPLESTAAMPSSPSCSSEPPNGEETCLTKRAMVDHAVNTDASLFTKPKQQEVKRPDWKYWKRSHPSSSYTQGVQHFP